MPPKAKAKKGKRADDDDYWDKIGTPAQQNPLAVDPAPPDDPPSQGKVSGAIAPDDEHAPTAKKKKKKANKDDVDDAEPEVPTSSVQPVKDHADVAAPASKKKKKGKKDDHDEDLVPEVQHAQDVDQEPATKKKKKGKKDDDVSTPPPASPLAPAPQELQAVKDDDDEFALDTKKKKKQKTNKAKDDQAPLPSTTPTAGADDDGDGDVVDATASAAKKKKKKKGKKDEDAAPVTPASAPAPIVSTPAPGKKKVGGGLGALRAMMEEKKRLEEEAKRREEEERRRVEEEERRAQEEARRKEEERMRKKEKEKAKRELAKKEGRLLTKKQKEERAAAELRRQALLASGVHIEGLHQSSERDAAVTAIPGSAKKVVYGARKKKPAGGGGGVGVSAGTANDLPSPASPAASSPAVESRPLSPEPPAASSVKDDWDASSEEDQEDEQEAEKTGDRADIKDAWDESSEEDEEQKQVRTQATPKASATASATASANTTKTGVKPQADAGNKGAPARPTKVESSSEESSTEESSSEDDSDESSEESSEEDDGMTKAQRLAAQRKAEAAARKAKAHQEALAAGSKDNLRSPICCILGHVDTGKTKLLDKIRQTNVQEGEAGGITQQIGATYFPVEAIKMKTAILNKDNKQEYKVPGLLVIDTPGHESFTNLRSRGSSLCNIAILVVDIMHGLEPQTLESLRLLRERKTPFIVALNKIDRMYGWEATPDNGFQASLAKQKISVRREFEDRVQKTTLAFAEQGLNAVLYYENKSFARNVSLVPTSAVTGEGVPDMIMLLVNLTQQRMSDRLMYLTELECTVLEVKVVEGLGTTIDVVLSNGILHEGDRIVVCGLNGPIVTQVRALLTPQPLRELRIKSQYVHHKEVKAALGVKLVAPELDKAVAGSRLLVIGPDDDEEALQEEVMTDLTTLVNSVDKSGHGVCVQASTLGSLEALLDFLKVSKIPVNGVSIGPVHKRDLMRCGTMLERAKELAVILAFDVPVDKDVEKLAEEMGIRIFKADIIYHLFDAFTAYNNEITEAKRRDAAPQAVWPCRLKTIAAFCKRDPIILGVDILDGTLRVGTPLCVVKTDPTTTKREIIDLGKVTSLEINHKPFEIVKKSQAGGGVAVKIEHAVYQAARMFGRHFDEHDELVSHITRQSIDVLKASFKADVSMEEWALIKALKPRLGVQ